MNRPPEEMPVPAAPSMRKEMSSSVLSFIDSVRRSRNLDSRLNDAMVRMLPMDSETMAADLLSVFRYRNAMSVASGASASRGRQATTLSVNRQEITKAMPKLAEMPRKACSTDARLKPTSCLMFGMSVASEWESLPDAFSSKNVMSCRMTLARRARRNREVKASPALWKHHCWKVAVANVITPIICMVKTKLLIDLLISFSLKSGTQLPLSSATGGWLKRFIDCANRIA
mmetsp:Transcript_36912/g.95259  ORF Transcript_36912/g.95259 Transcript_36912/m.95259 type:complete len:229 (-) Transcript_36912:573-1259(-)